jgi:hypothetical protein
MVPRRRLSRSGTLSRDGRTPIFVEQLVESCPRVARDLESDQQRAMDLVAVHQIDECERETGVDLVTQSHPDAVAAQRRRELRELCGDAVVVVHACASDA